MFFGVVDVVVDVVASVHVDSVTEKTPFCEEIGPSFKRFEKYFPRMLILLVLLIHLLAFVLKTFKEDQLSLDVVSPHICSKYRIHRTCLDYLKICNHGLTNQLNSEVLLIILVEIK